MAPTPKDQSMAEGLKKILGDIAQLATAPDADMNFLSTLQQAIAQQIRQGMNPQGQQPGQPGAQPPGAAGPAGMTQGGAMQGLSATGSGGIDMGAGAAPNMDEMNRALGSSSKAS